MMYSIDNPPTVLPEYNSSNLNEVLRIDEDPINTIRNYDLD